MRVAGEKADKPCPKCGGGRFWVKRSGRPFEARCAPCSEACGMQYRRKNPDKVRAASRRSYRAGPKMDVSDRILGEKAPIGCYECGGDRVWTKQGMRITARCLPCDRSRGRKYCQDNRGKVRVANRERWAAGPKTERLDRVVGERADTPCSQCGEDRFWVKTGKFVEARCTSCRRAFGAKQYREGPKMDMSDRIIGEKTDRPCPKCGGDREWATRGPKAIAARCKPCSSIQDKKYCRENKDKLRVKNTKWKRANPEKNRAAAALHLALKAGAFHDGSADAFSYEGKICFFCQYNPAESAEHLVPPSAGGAHVIENLSAACTPCNSSKGGERWGKYPTPLDSTKYLKWLDERRAWGQEQHAG